MKKRWRELKRSKPGKRFQEQYERANESGSPWKKPLWIGGGVLLVLAGLFLMVVPGPGLPILLVGAVLIAGQSLTIARSFDRLELKLQPAIRWGLEQWNRLRGGQHQHAGR